MKLRDGELQRLRDLAALRIAAEHLAEAHDALFGKVLLGDSACHSEGRELANAIDKMEDRLKRLRETGQSLRRDVVSIHMGEIGARARAKKAARHD